MRTKIFQQIRAKVKDSTHFFMGKKSLIKLAFGKNEEESYFPGLYNMTNKLNEEKFRESTEFGVMFTNESPKVIEKMMEEIEEDEFARGGFVVDRDIVKEKGVLEGFPTSMFEQLRKIRIPVELNKGVLQLKKDFVICKKGEKLTPEQAEALKVFGIKTAKFKINLLYRYEKTGKIMALV